MMTSSPFRLVMYENYRIDILYSNTKLEKGTLDFGTFKTKQQIISKLEEVLEFYNQCIGK